MEKEKSAATIVVKYAVIIALVMFIFSIVMYMTHLYLHSSVSWISLIILLVGIIFTVKDRRDKDLEGYITFTEGFFTGFLFCLLTSLFVSISSYFMMTFIAPEMIDEILKKAESDMIQKGLSDNQIEIAMYWTRKLASPPISIILGFIGTLFFGTTLSLIVAAVFVPTMFRQPFSFNGRIRRTEYGVSIIIYCIVLMVLGAVASDTSKTNPAITFLLLIPAIPLVWFILTQGTKRCHDLGNRGWFQLIPFYSLWMIFVEGNKGDNRFGSDPKNQGFPFHQNIEVI